MTLASPKFRRPRKPYRPRKTAPCYLLSCACSLLGNSVAGVILPLVLLATTGDALAAGTLALICAVPQFVIGLIGGALTDRFNRRNVSIVSDILSAASVALLPVVDMVWGLSFGWFVALGLLGAIGDIPGMTARDSLVPAVCERDGRSLQKFMGLTQSLDSLVVIVGPALAAFLMGAAGSVNALWFTAAMSLSAALITLTLPYIKSAREGVARLGMLVEKYGTYETNGVAFGDADEVWYWENIGGHHWIARRVPDDCYVVQPNRQGIDHFDLADALGDQHDYMCSADLAQWIRENDLLMDMPSHEDDAGETVEGLPRYFNARIAFSTYTWLDQLYNAPRKWYLCSRLTPSDPRFAGPAPEFGPESLDIPWAMRPDKKLSASDVKDLLATTYDGTEYDPYGTKGTPETRHQYRYVGIDRTSECSILCIRPNAPKALRGVHWFAPASGPFNTAVALYANVKELPAYLDTPTEVTTDSLYWNNRLLAGLSDPQFFESYEAIQGYRLNTMAQGYQSLRETDAALEKLAAEGKANLDDMDDPTVIAELERANQALVDSVQTQTRALLGTVLDQRTVTMKNAFNMNDH